MTDRDHQDSDVLGRYVGAPAAPVQGEAKLVADFERAIIEAQMPLANEANHHFVRRFREQLIAAMKQDELSAAYQRIDELERMLGEARLQIQYLHEKFQPTGSGEATLARIDAALLEPFPAESGA